MTSILQFIEKAGLAGVFDDHATKVMGQAFEAACPVSRKSGRLFWDGAKRSRWSLYSLSKK